MVEVIVVAAIIALLVGIFIPTAQAVRSQSYITQCAANLQRIGVAMSAYVTENRSLPLTRYAPGLSLVAGTGINSIDPFAPDGPLSNDVTAPAHLLRRTQKLPADVFVCPFSDTERSVADEADALTHSNFTDYHRNLGYSFAVPYPESGRPLRPTRALSRSYALAADINPGLAGEGDNVMLPTVESSNRQLRMANSANHGKSGQNVLFGDGHVEWTETAFSGPLEDNIFTNRRGETWSGPTDDLDVLLLPTDDR
jgi:prepilin-type processing-associated H-X9-DG protein